MQFLGNSVSLSGCFLVAGGCSRSRYRLFLARALGTGNMSQDSYPDPRKFEAVFCQKIFYDNCRNSRALFG